MWLNCINTNTHTHTQSATKTGKIWIRPVDCTNVIMLGLILTMSKMHSDTVRTDFNYYVLLQWGKESSMNWTELQFFQRWLSVLKEEWQISEGDKRGLSRVRKVKNYKKLGRGDLSETHLGLLSGHLSKLGSYPYPHYHKTRRQRPYLQMLAGTNSNFFWQPWVFPGRHFQGG